MPDTQTSAARAKFQVHIRGSLQAVWDEITRTDAPIPAFFNSRMDVHRLEPGARLATRKPMLLFSFVGLLSLRFDATRLR